MYHNNQSPLNDLRGNVWENQRGKKKFKIPCNHEYLARVLAQVSSTSSLILSDIAY